MLNVTAGTDNEIIQENHYYPFGMNQEGAFMNDAAARDTKYQYNSKELNDDFGLNWNDYGARWYDAAIGRWNGVDAMAEKYQAFSPFNYALNNPILFIDPDGQDVKPTTAFLASRYGLVYETLNSSSKTFRQMTKVFTDNETRNKFHYVLDYKDHIDRGRNEVGPALGKTRDISGLNFNGRMDPIGGEQTTFFIPKNEKMEIDGVSKQLNDAGRGLVVLHEAIHADINATTNYDFGLHYNHHDNYTEGMYNGIVDGLKEFNKAAKLGLTNEQIGLIAWNGLQGSPLFNKTFGLDPNSADYDSELDKINSQINAIIYNNEANENEKSRYNIKK